MYVEAQLGQSLAGHVKSIAQTWTSFYFFEKNCGLLHHVHDEPRVQAYYACAQARYPKSM